MNVLRKHMIRDAIAQTVKAGEGVNVDQVAKFLPHDFALEAPELLAFGQIEPKPKPGLQPTGDVDALRTFIREAIEERANLRGEIIGLHDRIRRVLRTRLANAIKDFVHGRQKSDDEIRRDYIRSEQQNRINGVRPHSGDAPRDLIGRIAHFQRGGQTQGNFRRSIVFTREGEARRTFPGSMKGAHVVNLPDGRQVIRRGRS